MNDYRKDINGLRAVAVLLVLLFHGAVPGFTSGFIGVDVFFVISGFLITSIIQSDIRRGKFSLPGFYVRRLWRIQVALLVVVAATLVLATLFYLPDDYSYYYKSALQTIVAGSNRFFAGTTTAYGAGDSKGLLLLHTWSLSIEWQWYLLLPLALVALNRLGSERLLKSTAAGFSVLSAALAIYLAHKEGSPAYYAFLPRIFEFLFGATLALWGDGDRQTPVRRSILADAAGLLALALIVAIACLKGVIVEYPNGWAVLVCAASTLVLWAGEDAESWTARWLSWGPLVFIGDISYSLYLWHWPIFATARYLGIQDGLVSKLACYALTFACAWLCYRYVEELYRRRKASLGFSLGLLVVFPLLVVGALNGLAHWTGFMPWRFGTEEVAIERKLDEHAVALRRTCMKSRGAHGNDAERCLLDGGRPPASGLMIGDSYSNQSWNFVGMLAHDAGIAVVSISTPSCLALPELSMEGWWKMNSQRYQVCLDHLREYYRLIDSGDYKYVILGENWLYYDPAAIVSEPGQRRSVDLGRQRLESGLRAALDRIVRAGAIPMLLKSPAAMPPDFQTCFYRHIKLRRQADENACPVSRGSDEASRWFDSLFLRLQKAYPPLVVIDPKDAQCDGQVCRASVDGAPVYRDVGHLTDYASYRLGEIYLWRWGNPFRGQQAGIQ